MNRKGFTLIELVIVIVILGILAATLAPKFMNLQRDAKVAVVKSLKGSIKTAMQIVRAKWLLLDNESIDNITLEDGTNIYVFNKSDDGSDYSTIYGDPVLDNTGLPKAVDYDPKKFTVTSTGRTGPIEFCYAGNCDNLDTDTTTGCGVYCDTEQQANDKYIIKCYANTGGCD